MLCRGSATQIRHDFVEFSQKNNLKNVSCCIITPSSQNGRRIERWRPYRTYLSYSQALRADNGEDQLPVLHYQIRVISWGCPNHKSLSSQNQLANIPYQKPNLNTSSCYLFVSPPQLENERLKKSWRELLSAKLSAEESSL